MKNIIFISPPAAGKGTQSKLLSQEYNIPHISAGDLLRDEVASGSELGKELKAIMDAGNLVDASVISPAVPLDTNIRSPWSLMYNVISSSSRVMSTELARSRSIYMPAALIVM